MTLKIFFFNRGIGPNDDLQSHISGQTKPIWNLLRNFEILKAKNSKKTEKQFAINSFNINN